MGAQGYTQDQGGAQEHGLSSCSCSSSSQCCMHEGVSGTLEDGRRGGIEGSGELSGKDVSEGRRASGVSGFLVGGGKEGTESGPVIAVGGGWVRTVLAQLPRRNGRQLWHCRPPFTHDEQFRQRPVVGGSV